LRQNDPCFAVRTEPNMPASEGSTRAERQPKPSNGGLDAASAGESVAKPGVRASIPSRWGISDLIATHLQLHLSVAWL
jgi:hypothetical protein